MVDESSPGAHPTDRRATLVTLTDQGAAAAEQMDSDRRAAAQALLGRLSPTDLAGFTTVADHVLEHLQTPPAPGRGT